MAESESESPVREGEIVAGKYRVERVLGVGGMGVVVAAMHIELEERFALKFLLAGAAGTEGVAARFAQEARAAAKVRSAHVARVVDVGRLPGGEPFMVMEYLEGEDLGQVLEREVSLPVGLAVDYVLQATEAIAEAHALGIVHRDLKPANLFLARRKSGPPIIKVLDFGISKVETEPNARLTGFSAMLGSPSYMAPEQLSDSRSVDARIDVWALGVVLYELLSGQPPFSANTMPELIASILHNPEVPLATRRPGVPAELAAIVHACLVKDRERRIPDVRTLAARLTPFYEGPALGRRASLADTTGSHFLPAASGARSEHASARTMAAVSTAAIDAPSEGRPWRAAVVGVVAGLSLVAAAVVVTRQHPASVAASPPSLAPLSASAPPPAAPIAVEPAPRQPAASASAEALPVVASASVPPPRHPRGDKERGPRPAASPGAKAAPDQCNPGYTVDLVTGEHHYKPECL